MATDERHPPSHMFTLKLWQEDLGAGQTEWRGQIQHVLTGHTRYFRGWSKLTTLLRQMLLEIKE